MVCGGLAVELIEPDRPSPKVPGVEWEARVGDARQRGVTRDAFRGCRTKRDLDQASRPAVYEIRVIHAGLDLPAGGSTLGRPAVVALIGITEQRLLDRVGQSKAAMARETIEPRLPIRRAFQGHDRDTPRSYPLGTAWSPTFWISHRIHHHNPRKALTRLYGDLSC